MTHWTDAEGNTDWDGYAGEANEWEPETDQNGVEFGRNCLSLYLCYEQNLCYGTCKLF